MENGGLQFFIKIDLKCSSYGPEHKTERFRSIEVIVNFWELVELKLAKLVFFDKKSIMFVGTFC
jgi:hypothetical protein